MSPRLTFRVLGPVEVLAGDRAQPIAAGKQRAILAALLLRPNRTVSIDELIDVLWGSDQPCDARGTVQKYIMRLRRMLEAVDPDEQRIVTELSGYRIVVAPGELDLDTFNGLVAKATRAGAGDDALGEAEALREALGLWQQLPPLSNVDSVALQRHEVQELLERYLHTLDRRIDVDLQLERHDSLVAELTGLTRRYPHRERLWAQLMRALHGSGRQSEALLVYREVVRLLADEWGLDPGAELRAAHQEVLMGSPVADVRWRAVRQLPRGTVDFTGRSVEVTAVTAALRTAPVVLTGMPGVGKTALAIAAAHQVADRYPDGQLYVDLGGSTPTSTLDSAVVLTHFLRALGVAPDAVPTNLAELTAVFRSVVAGRRVLVVLDDALDAAQVRDLIPGTPGSAVLISSRDELTGLAVLPGVRRIRVEPLSRATSRQLLASVVGSPLVTDATPGDRPATAESAAVDRLVEICGGLPLALRVAAAHLHERCDQSMTDYVSALTATADPSSVLRIVGDQRADLAAAFMSSYLQLGLSQRRLLRLVCSISDERITATSFAAASRLSPQSAAAVLEHLSAKNLLVRYPEGRYRMHPLLRSFVLGRRDEQAQERIAVPPGRHVKTEKLRRGLEIVPSDRTVELESRCRESGAAEMPSTTAVGGWPAPDSAVATAGLRAPHQRSLA